MRRLKIKHVTRYRYEQQVELLAHKLLLRPREGHDIRVESSRLRIEPKNRVLWHRDVHGNSVAVVEFSEKAKFLEIDSELVIEHYEDEPVEFSLDDRAEHFPFQYEAGERADLQPYLQPLFSQQVDALRSWIDQYWRPGQTLPTFELLNRMNREIPEQIKYRKREAFGVQSPSVTLTKRTGSCRDKATLFMEACRNLGIAARFVSGYQFDPNQVPGGGSTHAWCEVYLTGAGWRGFDSTTGEQVGGDHIAVAVARHPEWIPPVSGTFLGNTKAKLEIEVDVVQLT